ncbi:hypothetical protein KCM76_24845 [Zooshikella marina]|uniref:hypothetical protein n=1 Tax=Zooshikella ganghwensis TaxID=202772 RepID=UPI001BB09967|nr:hypothetical protein [Zooshikella ganghwensis]MBU2709247.1 hypothetical protein [Zooshikella ganghwensis]
MYKIKYSILFVQMFLALSILTANAESNRNKFQSGVIKGCSGSMLAKGNTNENTSLFCECFAAVLVNGMSEDEYQRAQAGDPSVTSNVLLRNIDKVRHCESLTNNATF